MRTNILKMALRVCAIAPLLAGCGSDGQVGGGIVTLPTCNNANQVLSTDANGQLICKDLPAAGTAITPCDPDFEALTSDTTGIHCTSRNNESTASSNAITLLKSVEKRIMDYGTQITSIGAGGPGAKALFQGVTTAKTNGAFSDPTSNTTGLLAATKLCAAQFGSGAHMCTVYEMYQSVALGTNPNFPNDKFDRTQVLDKSWVYMQSWKNPAGASPTDPTGGLSDNCASYEYPTADQKWTGTAVSWVSNTYLGKNTLKFYSGPADAPCNAMFPIACCK